MLALIPSTGVSSPIKDFWFKALETSQHGVPRLSSLLLHHPPGCLRCQARPKASPVVELGSLKGPPWAKPCHMLGLGKKGGAPWLGTKDSRGPGGNFDSGLGALAGIRRHWWAGAAAASFQEIYAVQPPRERGQTAPSHRPEGRRMWKVFSQGPRGSVLN